MASLRCKRCFHSIPLEWERCPHCARPGLFANVEQAKLPEERKALRKRYRAALRRADERGCEDLIRRLQDEVEDSQAVLNRSLLDAARLASSDRQLLASYYQLLEAEVRLPFGEEWDYLRRIADEAVFPGYKEKIRFAALTLDGLGLSHYGECALVLRDSMIAHRASVFEGNSTLLARSWSYSLPSGYRAVWKERSRLAVAKLADGIEAASSEEDFPALLLRCGAVPEEDQFVEVHIWGPLSVHCFETVSLLGMPPWAPTLLLAFESDLARAGVELRVS